LASWCSSASSSWSGANLLTLFLYGGLGGALYFLPFNLQQVQGYTPLEAGASLLPFTIIVFALSRWAGGLVPRIGTRPPLVVGPLIVAVGFALFARPSLGGSYWLAYFPATVALSLGTALGIAPLTTAVMSSAGQAYSGAASGINHAVSRTAGQLAIAVFNIVVVAVFSGAYLHDLNGLGLPPEAHTALAAQKTSLAACAFQPTSAPPLRLLSATPWLLPTSQASARRCSAAPCWRWRLPSPPRF
jgi:hypothetical protein